MSRRLLLLLAAAAILVIAGGMLLVNVIQAPELSGVTPSQTLCREAAAGTDCLRFPTISGLSLNNNAFSLPTDFEGELAVFVVVPFDENQQVTAAAWLNPVRALAESDYPGLGYYNLAVFPEIEAGFRVVIRAGLLVAIPDDDLRARSITAFLDDRPAFLEALDLPDADALAALLLSADGEILWRFVGPYSPEAEESLRAALDRLSSDT